jgi:hemerythrin-like metal-binding protein
MSNPPEPYFPLEPEYLVGIDVLDRQHKEIVDLLNELYGAIVAKKPIDLNLELLTRFLKAAKTHFATEEQVLRARSCPDQVRHKAAHEGLASGLSELRGQIARRKRELTIEYVELMKLWLIDHFVEFDSGYAKFLGSKNDPAKKDTNAERDTNP